LAPFVGHFGHERPVEHREFGSPRFDDDGVVGGGDDLALEGFGINMEAQRRNLGLAVEDVELEAANVGRHMAANERRHLCADGLGIHGRLLVATKGLPPAREVCPLRVRWMDAACVR
jgi:hypothetical protein